MRIIYSFWHEPIYLFCLSYYGHTEYLDSFTYTTAPTLDGNQEASVEWATQLNQNPLPYSPVGIEEWIKCKNDKGALFSLLPCAMIQCIVL